MSQNDREKEGLFKGADALAVVTGSANDDELYSKSASLQNWLLGYEFPDTCIVIGNRSIIILTSSKKGVPRRSPSLLTYPLHRTHAPALWYSCWYSRASLFRAPPLRWPALLARTAPISLPALDVGVCASRLSCLPCLVRAQSSTCNRSSRQRTPRCRSSSSLARRSRRTRTRASTSSWSPPSRARTQAPSSAASWRRARLCADVGQAAKGRGPGGRARAAAPLPQQAGQQCQPQPERCVSARRVLQEKPQGEFATLWKTSLEEDTGLEQVELSAALKMSVTSGKIMACTERPRAAMSSPAPLPKEIYRSAERGELQKVVKWLRKRGAVDAFGSALLGDGWVTVGP